MKAVFQYLNISYRIVITYIYILIFRLLATDHVGHTTVASSKGHVYDSTPPSEGHVTISVYGISSKSASIALDIHWKSISDPESDIRTFHVGLSSSPDGMHQEYIQYNVDGQQLTVDNTSSLTDGHIYYAVILVITHYQLHLIKQYYFRQLMKSQTCHLLVQINTTVSNLKTIQNLNSYGLIIINNQN